MDKIIPPTKYHANSDPLAGAVARAKPDEPDNSGELWRSTLQTQARLVTECTNDLLGQLARNRLMVAIQLKKMSAHSERMISVMAHSACRALAIATHARRNNRDRRVFSLPLPTERRFDTQMDRRRFVPGDEHI